MAHFALVDAGNVVRDVQVIDNADIGGGDFPAAEPLGQAWQTALGLDVEGCRWLQCSYSGSFRGVFPGQGFTYDSVADEFAAPVEQEPQPSGPPLS
jgi:hypothetical protein